MLLTLHLPFKVNIAKIILSRSGAVAMCNFAVAMCTFAAAMCRVGGVEIRNFTRIRQKILR